MKLDDPFGRVTAQKEMRYASFRESLQKAGVVDLAAAQECERGMLANAWRLTAVILVALAVAVILLPKAKFVSIVMASLALLWVAVSFSNGRKFLRRYKAEELSDKA